jgi:hypothetical protein
MRWGIAKHMSHGCEKKHAANLQRDLNSI